MPADARGRLIEDPFSYRVTKDGKVMISRGGQLVTTVSGDGAARLAARLAVADTEEAQHLLARATGNYRRGNERGGRPAG
jgi:hypothetical protein